MGLSSHRTPFGRKRLAIHVLVLGGTVFAIALYAMLIAKKEVCTGLIALQRFQFLCIFSSLGLILRSVVAGDRLAG